MFKKCFKSFLTFKHFFKSFFKDFFKSLGMFKHFFKSLAPEVGAANPAFGAVGQMPRAVEKRRVLGECHGRLSSCLALAPLATCR